MNYINSLKIFSFIVTFTFALPIFCAAPAAQSLDDKIAAIDKKSDEEILCTVLPTSQEYAQDCLEDEKRAFIQNASKVESLTRIQAKYNRSALKWWTIKNEIDVCNDIERIRELHQKLKYFFMQYDTAVAEYQKVTNSFVSGNMMPIDAYKYQASKINIFCDHASILLAKNEKLEQEKTQLLQKEQVLQAQLKGYQILENGPQIEGLPHAPGGPKIKRKRRGSF